MLKQTIQLRLSQQLTMTPQLQQAIKLLQLPVLDLQAEIRQALESNVMLEADDDSPVPAALQQEPEAVNGNGREEPTDVSYADVSSFGAPGGGGGAPDDFRDSMDFADHSAESLHEYLLWQLQMADFNDRDRAVGEAIIDAVNDDGYVTESTETIAECLRPDVEVDSDGVEAVLRRVQAFDPPGVAARTLAESLELQLVQTDGDVPHRETALEVARHGLELVASRQTAALRRRLHVEPEELDGALALLRSLNPRPGSSIASSQPQYVIPDVFVRRHSGRWMVEVNPGISPTLRVNKAYAGLLGRNREHSDLRTQLQEARWLIKSLEIRNETLVKVARCIVERQESFLDEGEEAMKPMVLRDVAETLGMHESTISRATTGKYMHTPRGVYEFRYFFSSHVAGADGSEVSSTAIRARIRKMIADETPAKPLSDSAIAAKLQADGIKVARRTVAKYRESLGLPSSSERRRAAAI